MLLTSRSSIVGYFLALIFLVLSPSLSHSQTLEELKVGVVGMNELARGSS
jgi:hypothetical protein